MPSGTCKVCCVAREEVHEQQVQLHLSRVPLAAIRTSPYMRAVRAALAAGRRIAACQQCWDEEGRGESSQRLIWNERFAETLGHLAGERATLEPLALECLQLSLGNQCNLACRMCNAGYSSRIAADPVHARWAPAAEVRAPPATGTRLGWLAGLPWFEQPRFVQEDLLGNSAALKLLTVTGGEPLLSAAFQELLDEYVARGLAPGIVVRVSSNLFHNEARVERLLQALGRFRHCSVGASVEACGPLYEYIRHPARWPVLARNLALVKRHAGHSGNVTLTVDVVVQPYNCLGLVELLRHADGLALDCCLHVLARPWFLRLHVLPRPLRLLAAERLRGYAQGDQPGRQAANRETALRVAKHLESVADEPGTAEARRHFAAFTLALDASRGQRLEDVVPELHAGLRDEIDLARAISS